MVAVQVGDKDFFQFRDFDRTFQDLMLSAFAAVKHPQAAL
ncbi:Uncharacterised protein [Morganella morganii]|nr:Uncharacterised protein [Morganella morganii]